MDSAVPLERSAVDAPIAFLSHATEIFFTLPASNYPADPLADTNWSCGYVSVEDIACAFNMARASENDQQGKSLPMLSFPDQTSWNAMSDSEKALWIFNNERIDRGLEPLHGTESNVTQVAQNYAQYLMDHNLWGHYEDGRSPWERLNDNPTIGACHDSLGVSENLAMFMSSSSNIPLAVERAIFLWMYEDSNSSWGHRHAILWSPYNDNSGPDGREGFLGIGRASGPHSGWNHAELIVMNIFDPCANWTYQTPLSEFSADPVSGASPLAVHFTDLSQGDVDAWHWDFGDGSESSEQKPVHTYANPGLYTVTLTVSGSQGSDTKRCSACVRVASTAPSILPWLQILLLDD